MLLKQLKTEIMRCIYMRSKIEKVYIYASFALLPKSSSLAQIQGF